MEARQIRYGDTNVEEALKNSGGSSELEARVGALEETVGDETGGLVKDVNDLETEVSSFDPNVYSTTETKIGKWGNEDLYRKCLFGVQLPNKTSRVYDFSLSNVTVRRAYGMAHEPGYDMVIPNAAGNTSNVVEVFYVSNQGLTVITGTDRSTQTADLILEYTKNSEQDVNNR